MPVLGVIVLVTRVMMNRFELSLVNQGNCRHDKDRHDKDRHDKDRHDKDRHDKDRQTEH